MFGDQGAVGCDRPRTAAQRDHARLILSQNVVQGARLYRPECRLAILFDDPGRRAPFAFTYERIEVYRIATKLTSESLGHSSFPAAHEANDNDATIFHTGNAGALARTGEA
jgi:hypothetical protein